MHPETIIAFVATVVVAALLMRARFRASREAKAAGRGSPSFRTVARGIGIAVGCLMLVLSALSLAAGVRDIALFGAGFGALLLMVAAIVPREDG